MPPIVIEVTLRERNQLTLPDRIATRLGVGAGDRLLLRLETEETSEVTLRRLRGTYAGVAKQAYGETAEDAAAYLAGERAGWDPEPSPGTAADGTPYLTFEESKRAYRQTEVSRERYESEPKLRWPKCGICGRSIARMSEHRVAHERGVIDGHGIHRSPQQMARSAARVQKWRATRAGRGRGPAGP